jgi:LemA protein
MKRRYGVGGVLLALLILVALLALIIGGCAYHGYNQAIHLDESVKSSWAQVENVLQRRFDLIPNLVETVKGYAAHEKEIFTEVAESRTKYFQAASQSERVEAANGVERALSRLLMLQERYPDLKAQANFLALQDELSGSENRIAVERKRYNDGVRELNTFCRSLLGRMYAGWAGVKPAEYFEVPEQAKAVPKVDFGGR